MVIQAMNAKLGVATGRNLPEVAGERFKWPTRVLLWIQAEIIAIATDLAEFIGAAIGLGLLTGVALLPAALLTGVANFAILAPDRRRRRARQASYLRLRTRRCGGRDGCCRRCQPLHANHGRRPPSRAT